MTHQEAETILREDQLFKDSISLIYRLGKQAGYKPSEIYVMEELLWSSLATAYIIGWMKTKTKANSPIPLS